VVRQDRHQCRFGAQLGQFERSLWNDFDDQLLGGRMRRQTHTLAILCLFCSVCFSSYGQQAASVPKLFDQLQSEETTNQATEQFLRLGLNNSEAKDYLAKRPPVLIAQDPKDHPHSWINEVRLAGEFRATEAIPAIAQWIGLPVGSFAGSTLSQREDLDGFPAGKALVKRGEPACPR
jgi:hypothetical protein